MGTIFRAFRQVEYNDFSFLINKLYEKSSCSVKLGIMAYIVPFIFVYSPALLLKGSIFDILWTVGRVSFGAFLLGIASREFFYRKLPVPLRGLLIVCAGGLFLGGAWYWLNICAAALGLATIAIERLRFCQPSTGQERQTV